MNSDESDQSSSYSDTSSMLSDINDNFIDKDED